METRQSHLRRLVVASAVLAMVVIPSAGCTGEPEPPKRVDADPSPSARPSVPTADPAMERYVQAANAANAEVEGTLIAAGARPTVVDQGEGPMTMVIRDEGAEEWKAGDYRLVVNCAGSGTLYAYFRLGDRSDIQEMLPCGTTVTTGAIGLRLRSAVTGSAVLIIPAGDVRAAVSYQIQRV
ncbi:hypothetical protein ACN26Y_09045 [Micromonospora sp. WMMD558]|uniref:hypothetical protein n=1 Tax=unclassified Micromonospora TaxID=2617518 RepID=UPI0012B4CAF8|nr:hypothetical protein [Micromonospora sp. WMMC415]QGN46417.1 hypothetical protein GKC29_05965 [Micromonospora sp. WMMC415]